MKRILLLLLFACGFAQAQIITFPDPIFKSRLLDASPDNQIAYGNGGYIKIDSNNDGEIQVAEAQAIDSLNVPFSHIQNITGIQSFVNLKKLNCNWNEIQELDVSNLTQLRELNCGVNQLQSLDLNQTPNLISLICDNNALHALSLNGFNALETLNCNQNLLTSLDVSGLPALKYLWCSGVNLQTINIGNAPNLEFFSAGGAHQLQALDFSGAPNMKTLYCGNNGLNSLDVDGLTQLQYLDCSINQLTTLNVSGLSALKDLRCSGNQLTQLILTGLSELEILVCYQNQLVSLDVSELANLQSLYCSINQLTSLDVTGLMQLTELVCSSNELAILTIGDLPQLRTLVCDGNNLTSLNLSSLPILRSLSCSYNLLTALDVSQLLNLNNLYCNANQLTTLDLSTNTNLARVNFMTNPLESVYMKNGGMQQYPSSIEGGTGPIDVANTPLQFICGDDYELAYWNSIFGNTLSVTSFCPFAGGAHNTIDGVVHFDADGNGCSASDAILQNIRIDITDGVNNGSTFTNDLGAYDFYVQQQSLTLTPVIENQSFYTITPANATITFPTLSGATQTQSFCITPNGVHNDVEVTMSPILPPRPGFDTSFEITYSNKGNQLLSGAVNFTFDEAILDYVTAYPLIDSQNPGMLSWNYSNLLPFETRKVMVTLNVNSPMETPAVNDGDILHLSAVATTSVTDENLNNNSFNLQQIVVNSFDPNNKICLEGNQIDPEKIGDYVHYTINFENTGTAAAERIVVKDVIDATKFDMATLQIVGTSHTASTRITGNRAEFIFENINLAPEAHGHVTFKIKTKSNLTIGSSVSNQANIFFDYNFPILTNNETSVFQLLANPVFQSDASVMIIPNPARDFVAVKASSNIKSIQLFDVQGRIVSEKSIDAKESKIDVSNLSKGIYLMKIRTEKSDTTERLIIP